ncbi:MAG: RsmE family RNA methyltransferase [Myxococcota bacterium]|nr:RsmE family RNA methyltransferase [Myxococcota bacterium]
MSIELGASGKSSGCRECNVPVRCKIPDGTFQRPGPWELRAELKHYLLRVHRLSPGDAVNAFDGTGHECLAELVSTPDGFALQPVSVPKKGLTGVPITICYGLPKGDKLDRVTRQLTELGIGHLLLMECDRSVAKIHGPRAEKKRERLRRIADEAARQSGRCDTLQISGPMSVRKAIESLNKTPCVVFDPTGVMGFKDLTWEGPVAAFVGPEGGFSQGELAILRDADAAIVSLGGLVLRTETAAPVAATLLLSKFGHF